MSNCQFIINIIVTIIGIIVSGIFAYMMWRLTKKISSVQQDIQIKQTDIQERQLIIERQKLLYPIYSNFLNIKEFAYKLLQNIESDVCMILTDVYDKEGNVTTKRIEDLDNTLRKYKEMYLFYYNDNAHVYDEINVMMVNLYKIACDLERLRKVFSLYIYEDDLLFIQQNSLKPLIDFLHQKHSYYKLKYNDNKYMLKKDVDNIKSLVVADLIKMKTPLEMHVANEVRIENIHNMLKSITNYKINIYENINTILKYRKIVFENNDFLNVMKKDCIVKIN